MIQAVVGQTTLTQIEYGNVIINFASQSLDERGFTTPGWAVQKITASIWYSPVVVPLCRIQEVLDVCNDALLHTSIQDHRVEWSLSSWLAESPPLSPPGIVDD